MNLHLINDDKYLRAILDAIPYMVLISDKDYLILDANKEAIRFIGSNPEKVLYRLCGEALHCLNAHTSKGGCGTTPLCADCVIRQTMKEITAETPSVRKTGKMRLLQAGQMRIVWFSVTASRFEYQDEPLELLVLEDVTELVELRQIIPICSHCRKVRDDANFWHHVEDYLHKHTGVQFSHGLCPDCLNAHYPEYGK